MNNTVATAKLKNIHIAPRKVRLVVGVVRGMHVTSALAQLQVMTNRSAPPLAKLIESAISNAKENGANVDNLVIGEIFVNQGIKLKRSMPRARGRATIIEKKMSHIELKLIELENKAPSFVMPKKSVKEKKSVSVDKKEALKPKKDEADETKAKERTGITKKIFQRKSI